MMLQQHLGTRTFNGLQAIWCPHYLNLELKLDPYTMFAWMAEIHPNVPHYKGLLEFINLRAQASEMFLDGGKKNPSADHRLCTSLHGKIFTSYNSTTLLELKITLYARLKGTNYMLVLSSKIFVLHKKVATLKSQNRCLNCLWTGHFVNHCKSLHASLAQVSETALHTPAHRTGSIFISIC